MKELLRLFIGALGGLSATGPMTLAMVALHRRLPQREQYELPPREVTRKALRALKVEDQLSESAQAALTLANHFAYGSACGAVYAETGARLRAPVVVKGLMFGGVVWALSYLGLLPAAGAMKPAHRHPLRRNLLMMGAHAIWGLMLAAFVETMREEQRRPRAALAGRSAAGEDRGLWPANLLLARMWRD